MSHRSNKVSFTVLNHHTMTRWL